MNPADKRIANRQIKIQINNSDEHVMAFSLKTGAVTQVDPLYLIAKRTFLCLDMHMMSKGEEGLYLEAFFWQRRFARFLT